MYYHTEKYRIEDIRKVTLNGKNVIIFKAYEKDKTSSVYVFCGEFSAPAQTANKNLHLFITE